MISPVSMLTTSQENVLPLIFEAAHGLPGVNLPPALKRQVMQQVISQTVRTSEFLDLNRNLRAAGVTPLVVKGIVCRNLYRKPDHRSSSDEDVLIPAEQFALCHRIFEEQGLYTDAREDAAEAYEVPYRKTGSMLYIELHKSLFPPESEAYGDLNRFFENVFTGAVAEVIQDQEVWTLDYTDHLFYLICHAFKHFLHSGFGIRQVCDIILFANRYGSAIDWLRVLDNCRQIRAEKFAAAMFAIGEAYLVFDPALAAYPRQWRDIQVDGQPMLEDLLSGGLYGAADRNRKHSSSITLDAVAAQKQGRQKRSAVLLSAFPSARQLQGRYPYLKQQPYLLPVAWGSRLVEYGKEIRQKRTQTAQTLKIANRRIELLKTYGILD